MSGNRAHADQRTLVLFRHGWQELSYHPHLTLNNPKEVLNLLKKKEIILEFSPQKFLLLALELFMIAVVLKLNVLNAK